MFAKILTPLLTPVLFIFFWGEGLATGQPLEAKYIMVDKWIHSKELLSGYIFDSFIDADGDLLLLSFRDGLKHIKKSEVINLTRLGQGPGEMQNWAAIYLDNSYLIDIEMTGKIIYFKKENKNYVYDKTQWLEYTTKFPHVRAAAFYKGKWYIGGYSPDIEKITSSSKGYFLSIYAEGKLLKQFLYKNFRSLIRGNLITVHLRLDERRLFLLLATEPILYLFDTEKDELINKIQLSMPSIYSPIKQYLKFERQSLNNFIKAFETWETSYSRIENFLITSKEIIIQFRIPDNKEARFCLAHFDKDNFKLKDICFTNDLLLGEMNGIFYFLEGGDPGLDGEISYISIKLFMRK